VRKAVEPIERTPEWKPKRSGITTDDRDDRGSGRTNNHPDCGTDRSGGHGSNERWNGHEERIACVRQLAVGVRVPSERRERHDPQ
jgi:hypothetical protein